jgi:hypothetical protein
VTEGFSMFALSSSHDATRCDARDCFSLERKC